MLDGEGGRPRAAARRGAGPPTPRRRRAPALSSTPATMADGPARALQLARRAHRRLAARRRAAVLDPAGGVSSGAFASLNLGRLTDDPGENVDENRARLAASVGTPRERFLYGRQVHDATVRRATEPPGPQRPHAPEDGQATALEDAPALVFVADCLPVVLVRRRRRRGAARRLARAGRPGSSPRAWPRCASSAPRAGSSAALGPSARGCCYEVGEEVHAHFADYDARVGERKPRPRPRSRVRSCATPGVGDGPRRRAVHDVRRRRCSSPHRRDGGVTGRQAGVAWRA